MGTIEIWPSVELNTLARKIIELASYFPGTDAQRDMPYVTSALRPTDTGSHHGGRLTWNGSQTQAVDFGDYSDPDPNDQDQRVMRDFASWLDRNFRPYIAELIHSTPYNTDSGFYVKYGVRYEGFSQATKDAHLNHVHVAFSAASIELALAKAKAMTGGNVLYGWDTSDYDWARALTVDRIKASKSLGMSFFTHKGTEQSSGTTFRHVNYGRALTAARDAGIPFLGMYIVPRSFVAVSTQCQTAINYANALTPWWRDHPGFFWQVDLEKWPYDAVPMNVGVEMCRYLESVTPKKAVLYASGGQYGNTWSSKYPRWNANYPTSTELEFKSLYKLVGGDAGRGWVPTGTRIWQYSSKGIVGAQRTCDVNAFKGTADDFARMIGAPVGGNPMWKEDVMYGKVKGNARIYASDGITYRWMHGDEAAAAWLTLTAAGYEAVEFPTAAQARVALGKPETATDAIP